ncbi:MAG: hypothetical protein JXA36_05980 [Coriobacteriia bacterium]|nr:hypothetical protein [Coriobacteriia bacterium]
MRNIRRYICLIACATILSAIGATPLWAVARTTPVEILNTPFVGIDPDNCTVKAVQAEPWYMNILGTPNFNVANSPTVKIDGTTNTVKIDATTNTVKATQSGAWNVGITGTPSVAQSGTWNVGVSSMPTVNVNTHAVTQSGTWNVGINGTPGVSVSNTPSVTVSNSPTVRIDSAANAVDTPTRGYAMLLFGSNQVIPTGSQAISSAFNCSGYKEVRFAISTNYAASTIYASVEFQSPLGATYWSSVYTQSLNNHYTAFCVPVYNASCRVRIVNNVGATATIYSESWVYMVN